MAKKKKNRKIGQIGVRKSPDFKHKVVESKVKKGVGKPSGSRNNASKIASTGDKLKVNKDPRLGSKKPVNLYATAEDVAAVKLTKPKFFSPEQELAAIEDDAKLARLIEQLDAGESLDNTSQRYVDIKLARHQELCRMLGISDDADDTNQVETKRDLLSIYENVDINKLKNL
jgi:uncharacterized protein